MSYLPKKQSSCYGDTSSSTFITPFPRETANDRIDTNDFKRAVGLLVYQGTEMLGTQAAGDYFWGRDDAFIRSANVSRILKSIGLPDEIEAQHVQLSEGNFPSVLSDTVDVLAMTQPHLTDPADEGLAKIIANKVVGDHVLTFDELIVRVNDLLAPTIPPALGGFIPTTEISNKSKAGKATLPEE
ncbi:hypothetical protein BBP40_001921 [Aspergillus hancockii]|nr:hypothetical protein BBP40_001921 [Aspergillus hancockii]